VDLAAPADADQVVTMAVGTPSARCPGWCAKPACSTRTVRRNHTGELERQWAINVAAHFLITKAAVEIHAAGSAIVFVSSHHGTRGIRGLFGLCRDQGAVEALSRTLASNSPRPASG